MWRRAGTDECGEAKTDGFVAHRTDDSFAQCSDHCTDPQCDTENCLGKRGDLDLEIPNYFAEELMGHLEL